MVVMIIVGGLGSVTRRGGGRGVRGHHARADARPRAVSAGGLRAAVDPADAVPTPGPAGHARAVAAHALAAALAARGRPEHGHPCSSLERRGEVVRWSARHRRRQLRGARAADLRADRPERRRQDHALQLHHRPLPARRAATCAFAGSSIVGQKPHQIALGGIARTFQNVRLFGRDERARERDGRRAPHHALGRARRHAAHARLRGRRAQRCTRAPTSCSRSSSCSALQRRAGRLAGLRLAAQARDRARADARRPSCCLLDEPAAGLNSQRGRQAQAADPLAARPASRSRWCWSSTTCRW